MSGELPGVNEMSKDDCTGDFASFVGGGVSLGLGATLFCGQQMLCCDGMIYT